MTTNTIKTEDGYRRITISRNKVKISISQKEVDNGSAVDTKLKEKYQIINEKTLSDEHKIAQCIGRGEKVVYSITHCQKICQAPQTASVKYFIVGDELFVKVVDDDKESIYDEIGNLIEADRDNHLSVVFGGCGLLIKKTSKKDGREKLYNFEGYFVG